MKYEYYKNKYKAYTLRLDREKDADIIKLLDNWPDGPKAVIMIALRALKAVIHGRI